MAGTEEVRSVHDVLRDAPSGKEPRLVGVHQGVDVPLKASAEGSRDGFHDAVLQRDGPEIRGGASRFRFRKENQEGTVDPSEVDSAGKEVMENCLHIGRKDIPKGDVERRAKTVRAGA